MSDTPTGIPADELLAMALEVGAALRRSPEDQEREAVRTEADIIRSREARR